MGGDGPPVGDAVRGRRGRVVSDQGEQGGAGLLGGERAHLAEPAGSVRHRQDPPGPVGRRPVRLPGPGAAPPRRQREPGRRRRRVEHGDVRGGPRRRRAQPRPHAVPPDLAARPRLVGGRVAPPGRPGLPLVHRRHRQAGHQRLPRVGVGLLPAGGQRRVLDVAGLGAHRRRRQVGAGGGVRAPRPRRERRRGRPGRVRAGLRGGPAGGAAGGAGAGVVLHVLRAPGGGPRGAAQGRHGAAGRGGDRGRRHEAGGRVPADVPAQAGPGVGAREGRAGRPPRRPGRAPADHAPRDRGGAAQLRRLLHHRHVGDEAPPVDGGRIRLPRQHAAGREGQLAVLGRADGGDHRGARRRAPRRHPAPPGAWR